MGDSLWDKWMATWSQKAAEMAAFDHNTQHSFDLFALLSLDQALLHIVMKQGEMIGNIYKLPQLLQGIPFLSEVVVCDGGDQCWFTLRKYV